MAIDFEKLIRQIVMPLVVNPESVMVKVISGKAHEDITVSLLVAKEDLGRVIGRGGKIASAIRTIIYAGASKEGKRVHLEIDSV